VGLQFTHLAFICFIFSFNGPQTSFFSFFVDTGWFFAVKEVIKEKQGILTLRYKIVTVYSLKPHKSYLRIVRANCSQCYQYFLIKVLFAAFICLQYELIFSFNYIGEKAARTMSIKLTTTLVKKLQSQSVIR